MKRDWALLVFVALVALAGYSGMRHLPGPFYEALAKPEWTPPSWLFPPVWGVLYVMIAVAGWIIWRAQGLGPAFWVWLAALALNAAWSWIMFGQKEIAHALYDIVALWLGDRCCSYGSPGRCAGPRPCCSCRMFLWVTLAVAARFRDLAPQRLADAG